MAEENKGSEKLFRGIVIVILLVNTYFISGIWCATTIMGTTYGMSSYCPMGKNFCPWSKKKKYGQDGAKICPLTGKPLQSSGVQN